MKRKSSTHDESDDVKRVKVDYQAYKFLDLANELLMEIIDYLPTREWIQFSYTCKRINHFKWVQLLMIHKVKTFKLNMRVLSDVNTKENIVVKSCELEEVRQSFALAKGTHFAVKIEDEFSDLYQYLEGSIHTLILEGVVLTDRELSYFSTVRHLEFHTVELNCTDEALKKVLANLTSFSIFGETKMSIEAFHSLSNLKELRGDILCYDELEHLWTMKVSKLQAVSTFISDDFIDGLDSKQFDELDISECFSDLTDEGILMLEMPIPVLRVSGCKNLTNLAISYLRGVKELDVSACNLITDEAFKSLRCLKKLSINFCEQLTGKFMVYLSGSIRELTMVKCTKVEDQYFEHIQDTIQVLNISDCSGLSDSIFKYLGNVKQLIMHGLKGGITCQSLGDLKSIEHLSLDTLKHYHWSSLELLTSLKSLKLNGKNIAYGHYKSFDKIAPYLPQCVERLTVSAPLSTDTFKYLQKVKYLKLIDHNMSCIYDHAFSYLREVEEVDITKYSLEHRSISEKMFEYLGKLEKLRVLRYATRTLSAPVAKYFLPSVKIIVTRKY